MSELVIWRSSRAQLILIPRLLLWTLFSISISSPTVLRGESQSSSASTVQVAAGVAGLTANAGTQVDAETQQRVDEWMSGINSGFQPNRGQVANSEGKSATEVLLSANVRGAQVYVTTSGLSHYFLKRIGTGAKQWRPKGAGFSSKEFEWCRLDVDLLGASISPDRMVLEEPLTDMGVTNFYRGHCPDGVVDVATYAKITFTEVYRGIDWVVLSRPGEAVQYDFVVRPGADPSQIRMEYKGASSIEMSDDARRLTIQTPLGEVQEGALHCYQGDPANFVGARYHLEGNIVAPVIDDYDHSQPLTIDPPLVWSTYYGGSNFDGPRSILCDNVNNTLYVVGYSYSNNMPTQNAGGGAFYQGTFFSGTLIDGFIWKFTQSGVRLWATYYGGLGDEINSDAVLDQFQNLYVSGATSATNWPTQILPGAYNQGSNAGGANDAVIIKFNSLGVRQWASYFGGSEYDWGTSLVSDASGSIFMTGYTQSPDFPLVDPGGGAYFQNTLGAVQDAFVAKFSPVGVLEWSTYLGGPDLDEGYGIASTVGSIYVTGATKSPTFPVYNPGGGAYFDGSLGGMQDGFISRFSLSGVQMWSTYYGGDSTDWAEDPVVDGAGRVFVAGYTESSNFPTLNPGGTTYYQGTAGGDLDVTLAKFDSANVRLWATYYGGSDVDFLLGVNGKSITLDPQGRLYVTGLTSSLNFPVLNPGGGSFYQGAYLGGANDAFIGRFSNNGTMLWSTYWGSDVPDFGCSISIGNSGCVFATGETVGVGSLFLQNPLFGAYFQSVSGGLDDGYIAKFCQPTGACCIDFTCVGANSQAECTLMGGQIFFPDQPCSTTVCSILCNICGTKYNDLNKNGSQDPGEPGIPGWTVQLYYWNGPLFASMTTDSLGNYCFNNIPCGAWTVNEQLQQGWVQTDPSPNVHNVSMGPGTTLNDIDFGNTTCVQDTCCVKPALGMIAWYPFDEDGPDFAHDIAAKTRNGWQYLDQSGVTAGKVGKAFDFDSARYVRVFDDPFAQIDTGDFTIDAWIEPTAFTTNCENYPYHPCAAMPIVDNRRWVEGANGDNGILFYVKPISSAHGRLGLAMNIFPNPIDSFETATAPIVLNEWQHVAVTVARNGGTMVGTFYYNGSAVGTFVPHTGSVFSTTAPGPMMDIGHGPFLSSYGAGQNCRPREKYFAGPIDEVEIFGRALIGVEVQDIYLAGSRGKCKISCAIPTSVVLCRTATTVTMNMTVCNQSPFTSVANFSFAPLASGSGCNFDASGVTFSPASGTITLLPGQCTQIPVTLTRPAGFTPGNIACFCVTVRDTLTGAMSTCCSKLLASNGWCVTVKDPRDITHLNTGQARAFNFTVKNETDAPATFDYTLRAEGGDHGSTPTSLALNGLPPGTPVIGSISLPPWGEGDIVGDAVLMSYRPMDLESIHLEADIDGDGLAEPLGTVLIQPTSFPDCNKNGVDDSLDLLNGTSVDANSNGFPDDCEGVPSNPSQCYLCGDADASNLVTISDAVYLINYIFSGGPAPNPTLAGDANCDNVITISDAVYLVNYIFSGGAPPCAACP